MKKQIIAVAIITFFTACTDEVETVVSPVQQTEIDSIKEFVIPDTIDVKKELVIAAYYERHPQAACVIIAYNDSTKTSFKRYSYSSDSSFVVEDLVSRYYNEFKIKKDTSHTFTVKPTSVVYILQGGSTGMSAEFKRIDVPQ